MRNEDRLQFPFHYGNEGESYSFYRVPKILFTETAFDCLSTDAKLLYGLLLDRMQLSMKNGWVDESGRVFIYYTVDSIMEALSCGNKKVSNLLAELDDKRGIGLISRTRQGQGKPDRIYVHKCITPEMSKRHFQKCHIDASGDVLLTGQGMSKGHASNTDKNNTKMSETDLISSATYWDEDAMEERKEYRAFFMENCAFDVLKSDDPYSSDVLDEILELLVEVCCSKQRSIRISGDEKPIQVVKSRFMKLNQEHIQYVLDCLQENTTKVRNIKQYLLATLYNAPMTIGNYYKALVQHDMYGKE